jgi:multidrug resistance efflux pump
MELLFTVAYFFLVRLVFFDYKRLKFTMFWQFVIFGLYAAAFLTEIVLLGQYTPYSKESFVQAPVVQLAPQFGGEVVEVTVEPNVSVKMGTPLLKFDTVQWQARVDQARAELVLAEQGVSQMKAELDAADDEVAVHELELALAQLAVVVAVAALDGAEAQFAIDSGLLARFSKGEDLGITTRDSVDNQRKTVKRSEVNRRQATARLQQAQKRAESRAALDASIARRDAAESAYDAFVGETHATVVVARAALATAEYHLSQRTLYAPSDGFVTNLQVRPGTIARIKSPVMSFVSDEEHWIVFKLRQNASQYVRPGDPAEVAFDMYPGRVFEAEVSSIAWANREAQGVPTGLLPRESEVKPAEFFYAHIELKELPPEYPVRFGAKATVAIYPKVASDALILLRKLEIRSESWLNYLFNPF